MNHEQAEWMLRALANQTAALERIAAAVEQIAKAAQAEPVVIPACPDSGGCHGSQRWCDECGDVSRLCLDAVCDVHGNYHRDGDR